MNDQPFDLEVAGTFSVGGKLIAAYNKAGDPLYVDPRWEYRDGELRQIAPMRLSETIAEMN